MRQPATSYRKHPQIKIDSSRMNSAKNHWTPNDRYRPYGHH